MVLELQEREADRDPAAGWHCLLRFQLALCQPEASACCLRSSHLAGMQAGWRACLPVCLPPPWLVQPGCVGEGGSWGLQPVWPQGFLRLCGWRQLVSRTVLDLCIILWHDADHSHCLAALAMPPPASFWKVVMMIMYVPACYSPRGHMWPCWWSVW